MARITYLTTIDFGPGEVAGLPAAIAELGMARPLLISDEGIRAAGLLDRVAIDGPAFLGTPPNPTEEAVAAALEVWRAEGCDGIVALGGGSPIDLAKGVALLATHPGAARALRGDLRRHPADRAGGGAGDRDPDDGGDRRRGRAGGAPDARRRPQARLHQPAPDPEAGDLRPGADARPAAGADRGDRARRALALHRDVPLAARQPAGGGDRARRRRAASGGTCRGPARRAATWRRGAR